MYTSVSKTFRIKKIMFIQTHWWEMICVFQVVDYSEALQHNWSIGLKMYLYKFAFEYSGYKKRPLTHCYQFWYIFFIYICNPRVLYTSTLMIYSACLANIITVYNADVIYLKSRHINNKISDRLFLFLVRIRDCIYLYYLTLLYNYTLCLYRCLYNSHFTNLLGFSWRDL